MRLLIAALIAPFLAMSAEAPAQRAVPFDASGIRNFCAAVSSPLVELHPVYPSQRYGFESYLAEWALVRPDDPVPEIHRKIGRFLNANMPSLLCNQVNFNPRNGNILKLAVLRQSNSFIRNVLTDWHVDLNQIDAADGKTVLDYIQDRRARAGSTSLSRTMDRYYTSFRAAGARHASELRP